MLRSALLSALVNLPNCRTLLLGTRAASEHDGYLPTIQAGKRELSETANRERWHKETDGGIIRFQVERPEKRKLELDRTLLEAPSLRARFLDLTVNVTARSSELPPLSGKRVAHLHAKGSRLLC